jgi:hypothetical protein
VFLSHSLYFWLHAVLYCFTGMQVFSDLQTELWLTACETSAS